MRESIDLKIFNVGLISNPDQEDIPNEAQTEGSINLDSQVPGKLAGIKKHKVVTSYGAAGKTFEWIERIDGDNIYYDLVYYNGEDVGVITDFYEDVVTRGLVTSGLEGIEARVIVANNQEVHIGQGKDKKAKWLGYISHRQFDTSNPTKAPTLTLEDAELAQPSTAHQVYSAVGHLASTEGEGAFPYGYEYDYKISFMYDGYQESPLGGISTKVQVTEAYDYITIGLKIVNYLDLNPRITGIKVYRRERPFFDSSIYTSYQDFLSNISGLPFMDALSNTLSQEAESIRLVTGSVGAWGEYKLVKDIDINELGWTVDSGNNMTFSFDDKNEPGPSYLLNTGIEERTGYDDVYYTPNYGLATTTSSYMFIGNASHPKLPEEDAAHMLFRSKPYRYDMFDWVNDRLILPTIPKAMKGHRDKLYVWDENTTYVIDPIKFSIEKTITGRGCADQRSVVNTDYGLFWANKNGVYWSELSENLLKPTQDNLTEPIKAQYQYYAQYSTPVLTYNSQRNQLLVHLGGDCFAYDTVQKRWDFYEEFTRYIEDPTTGAFIGRDGETYTVSGELNTTLEGETTASGAIMKDFGDDNETQPWSFVSKEFADDPSQLKKYYKIVADCTDGVGLSYSTDGGDTWISVPSDGNLGPVIAKSIRIRIDRITVSEETLDSISIIYRRMRGKR